MLQKCLAHLSFCWSHMGQNNNKTCVKRPLSKRPKQVFKIDYRLMKVKSNAECSLGRILQYFRPSLSYQLSLRPLFRLFSSGRFTQVLLYILIWLSYILII